nr:hypothetical protein F511_31850 [Ipomoea trifida]GMD05791.1 DUF3511 domain protein [Ipomoea batatas]GMD09384.1 DUF3511 domain protein [Ipomoea batatas]GMD10724.1 DUF3511 domain protein [Ipomoea batatas]GME12536.1 DUF3511 domain protein [Ipomoea batatas]
MEYCYMDWRKFDRRPRPIKPPLRSGLDCHLEKAGPKSKPASSRAWYSTPELKRKKRIAKYKLYLIEARMKDSLRKEFRSFKRRCSTILNGFP